MTRAPRVLIADDQPDILEALRLLLKGEGYVVESARSPLEVLEAVRSREFDAVLADLNYTRDTTSGREGLDLLQQVVGLEATLPIVVMTAWASIDNWVVDKACNVVRNWVRRDWRPESGDWALTTDN